MEIKNKYVLSTSVEKFSKNNVCHDLIHKAYYLNDAKKLNFYMTQTRQFNGQNDSSLKKKQEA